MLERDGLAARLLAESGVEVARVRSAITEHVGRAASQPSGQLPLTPRASGALESSAQEADRLGHALVGTEHVLLGLAREPEGLAAELLERDYGLTPSDLREEVVRKLGGI